MKKNFITKEYSLESKAGTFSMLEKRNFFGSKILEIDDVMTVDENAISWNEASDGTQDVNIDDQTKTVNTTDLKDENHEIRIFPKQSNSEIKEFTTWELSIDIHTIIRTWIYGQLKKFKTFATIRNEETRHNSIDDAIYEYIDLNIIPRIDFATILLYIRWYKIGDLEASGQPALQFNAQYTENTIVPPTVSGESNDDLLRRTEEWKESILATNFNLSVDSLSKMSTILYKQTESSQFYKFNYYFDVVYQKA